MNAKKVISFIMSIVMIATLFGTVACADTGYGDSSDFIEDDISDKITYQVDPDYAVSYIDFETAAKAQLGTFFNIIDFDDAHGKVLEVYHTGWSAIGQSSAPTTYTWNGQTHNMFFEPCTIGKHYIMSFESYINEDSNTKENVMTIAPQHAQFSTGNDYRFFPDASEVKVWKRNMVEFLADTDKLKVKLNTYASGVHTLIDNLIVVEAAAINISDTSGATTVEDIYGNLVQGTNAKSGGTWASKGMPAKLKIATDDLMEITSVMHGTTEIQPDADGNYPISSVTSDITINVGVREEYVAENISIDDENVYLPFNSTRISVAKSSGINKNCINVLNSADASLKQDATIKLNDKLNIAVGASATKNYNVKILGDYDANGTLSVTDLLSAIDHVLLGTSALSTLAADVNRNGKITVSDVVANRKILLTTDTTVYTPDSDLIDSMDAFTTDVINRTTVPDINETNLENSIYNVGNRTRIANVMKKAMRGEDITIVYFGGSITARSGHSSRPDSASGLTPSFPTGDNSYTDWITYWWQDMFAEKYGCDINFVNAGIGATDTPYAVHRMHHDVLPYDPDLVIVEWCVNDDKNIKYKQGTYEAMVRQFLEHEEIALLMLSMANKTGASSQELHEPIADSYDVPMVSYRDAYLSNPLFSYFTTDATHPNIVGHPLAGILVDYYLQKVYEELDTIGVHDSAFPKTLVHEEADDYDGAYIASFKDIYDGKIEGVRITDLGSFSFETNLSSYGNGIRKYYAIKATAASSYSPLVMEIDNLKTAFALVYRAGTTQYSGATFKFKLNGTEITDSTFTCKHGGDNTQTEMTYHWATQRICYYPDGIKAKLELYPTMNYSTNPSAQIRLFAMLLS